MQMLRDARLMSGSAAISVAMAVLRSVLVLRILGPTVMGIWKTVMVIYMTGEFLRLGITKGLSMRLPEFAGRGREDEIEHDLRTAGAYIVLAGIAFAAVLLVASLFATNDQYALALQLMAAVMLLAQPHQYLRELAAARQRFDIRGRELMLAGVIDLIGGVVLSYCFGLAGIGIATVVGIALPVLYLWRSQPDAFRAGFELARAKVLMTAGIPVSLSDSMFGLLRYLDLLLLTPLLGPTMAGYYAVSMMINEFSIFVANFGVSQVISSHLLQEYGRLGCVKSVVVFYEVPIRLFSYILPPLLAVGTLMVGPMVRLILPQYTAGIEAAEITVWGVFFLSMHSAVTPFFRAAERFGIVLKLLATLLVLTAAGQWLVLSNGGGLVGAAWLSLAALGVLVNAELFVAREAAGDKPGSILGFLISINLPLVLMIALMQVMEHAEVGVLAQAGVLVAVYTPVLAIYESRFSMLRMVRQNG
jgi:O-antigen/teichoic acid export membrane protein